MKQYNLTRKQLDVYNYIKDYISKYNKSPYIREIQEACGINSYKITLDRLSSLEKKGYIRRRFNKHRSIILNKRVNQKQLFCTD
jgi:repressor LexA